MTVRLLEAEDLRVMKNSQRPQVTMWMGSETDEAVTSSNGTHPSRPEWRDQDFHFDVAPPDEGGPGILHIRVLHKDKELGHRDVIYDLGIDRPDGGDGESKGSDGDKPPVKSTQDPSPIW